MLNSEDRIQEALSACNGEVYAAAARDPALTAMGTTVADVVVTADLVQPFNVGDSRCMRPTPAVCARAAATVSADVADCRISAAWAAVMCLETPPGSNSHSTAWSRRVTQVRLRPGSRYRLDHTFSRGNVVIGLGNQSRPSASASQNAIS